MELYAVALAQGGVWIEFYEADDAGHAKEQATEANPYADILAIAWVRH